MFPLVSFHSTSLVMYMVGRASICQTVTGRLAVVVVVEVVVVLVVVVVGAVVVVVVVTLVVVVEVVVVGVIAVAVVVVGVVVVVVEVVVVAPLELDRDWYVAFIAKISYSSGSQVECLLFITDMLSSLVGCPRPKA